MSKRNNLRKKYRMSLVKNKKYKTSINQRGAKASFTNQSPMRYIIAIKVDGKVEMYEFQTQAEQMACVEGLRQEFPNLEFCYSIAEAKG